MRHLYSASGCLATLKWFSFLLSPRPSAQGFERALPDEPQAIKAEPGFLNDACEFPLLSLRQFDFLRADVIIHLPKHLEPLHLMAKLAVHPRQGGLVQTRGRA